MKIRAYTLIELVAVLAIFALMSGLIITRVRKIPAFVTADKLSSSIQALFARASMMSQMQNKTIKILFAEDQKTFSIRGANDNSSYSDIDGFLIVEIPGDFELSLSDKSQETYSFYPDGSASGGAFSLDGKGFRINFKISPLTGLLIVKAEKS
jgi:prepilin-type N-terminal cleavage/methylation domain-containing protein